MTTKELLMTAEAVKLFKEKGNVTCVDFIAPTKNGDMEVFVKTYCCGEEACGTESPNREAREQASKLGNQFHWVLSHFEPCEKGWGSFIFKVK